MTAARSGPSGAIDRIACDATLARLPLLLGLLAAVCRREKIEDPARHDLRLIVEEACVNVMHHAYPAGQSGPMALAVRVAGDGGPRRAVLTLEDLGRPFDPLSVAPVDTTAAAEARVPGGLGVHLIRQLSDRQHYQRHPLRGNVLTVEKYLPPPASH